MKQLKTKRTKNRYNTFVKPNSRNKSSGASQTRPVKKVGDIRLISFLKRNRLTISVLALLLMIAVIAHSTNMTHFPYFENDEATYISRAWTFVTHGNLDPYTYRYDHPPIGWIFIGIWLLITGGAHVFSSLLVSGRVLMLAVHLITVTYVFFITKRTTNSRIAAFFASALYTLSPLGIYFQRRILLDNIMTMFMMMSFYYAMDKKRRLNRFQLSALLMGIAVLTKLTALFVIPSILYLVYAQADKRHRKHVIWQWAGIVGISIAFFLLYSLLKGELLPASIGPDGIEAHVSLISTTKQQLGRGDFVLPWKAASSFYSNAKDWLGRDKIYLLLGCFSLIVTAIKAYRDRYARAVLLYCVLLILFYARGKMVLNHYILPLLPGLALSIGYTIYAFMVLVRKALGNKRRLAATILSVIVLTALSGIYTNKTSSNHVLADETSNQILAENWVADNLPKDSRIVIDNYAYPYLRYQKGFTRADYMFAVEYDPGIEKTYDNDWRNLDYILVTHEIMQQIKNGSLPKIKLALDHSTLIASFTKNTTSYLDLPKYISTNGDWAQVYKVKSRSQIRMQDDWRKFIGQNISSYGQVSDPSNSNKTTSMGQAKGLSMAIAMHDKAWFNGIYQWTSDHMQHRQNDKLFSGEWGVGVDGNQQVINPNTDQDANALIAANLFKAYELWKDPIYKQNAEQILADMHVSDLSAITQADNSIAIFNEMTKQFGTKE